MVNTNIVRIQEKVETRCFASENIKTKPMTKNDLVIGKKYNWLHEPGVTITYKEKLGNDTYFFRDQNNSPIAMQGNEVPDSVSEIMYAQGGLISRFKNWLNQPF